MGRRLRRAGSPWRLLVHEYVGGGRYGVSHHVASTAPGGKSRSESRDHVLPGTEFDELVVGRWLRVEQMNASQWWVSIAGVVINISVDRDGRAKAVDVFGPGDYDAPLGGVEYELTWGQAATFTGS